MNPKDIQDSKQLSNEANAKADADRRKLSAEVQSRINQANPEGTSERSVEERIIANFRKEIGLPHDDTFDEDIEVLNPSDLIELDDEDIEELKDEDIIPIPDDGNMEKSTDVNLEMDSIDKFLQDFPNDLTRISDHSQGSVSLFSSIGVKKDGANHENQDYIYSDNSITICCDGVGSGQLSGEIAKEFALSLADISHGLTDLTDLEQAKQRVNQLLSIINNRLKQRQIDQPEKYDQAGSTLAVVVNLKNNKKLIFTTGDSEVLKLNFNGEVETLTNPHTDTLFHFVLKQMGIQDVKSFMDISYIEFMQKLKNIYTSFAHLNNQEFIETLAQSLNLKGLNFAKNFLISEQAYKKGRQVVIKGVLQNVEISEGNIKIVKQKQDEFLIAATDGLTDQMTYDQIGQVFLFGGIKSLIQNYSTSHPEILDIENIQQITESKYIIDIDSDINLSKILNSIINLINPKKLFRKADPIKANQIKKIINQAGTHELNKESIANMLGERLGILGYKTPKKDNISIATI